MKNNMFVCDNYKTKAFALRFNCRLGLQNVYYEQSPRIEEVFFCNEETLRLGLDVSNLDGFIRR